MTEILMGMESIFPFIVKIAEFYCVFSLINSVLAAAHSQKRDFSQWGSSFDVFFPMVIKFRIFSRGTIFFPVGKGSGSVTWAFREI